MVHALTDVLYVRENSKNIQMITVVYVGVNNNMTSVRCNLCGQEFIIDDDDIRDRMLRHKERHNPIGSTASSNIIRGEVEYIVIDWENEDD